MTDITASAVAARESARETGGQFGAQQHSAPELTIADPKQQVVDSILAERFGHIMKSGGLAADDGLDLDDVRELMLAAISQHQSENPAVVVIDGNGRANDAAGTEIIELEYLGEWYDDGNDGAFHVERATDDLDRLRAAGLGSINAANQLREYIGEELGADWYDDDEHVLGGRFGDFVIDEGFHGSEVVKVREVETGVVVGTYFTFAEAKAAAESA